MNSSIDIIEALFGGRARVAILRLLAASTTPLTGRQVAELTGLSQPGTARPLEHFADLGVVSRRRVGRAILHELQRDNALVETIVVPVMEAERGILDLLEKDLEETFAASTVSVVLFGSALMGAGVRGGDIDVLLVAEDNATAERVEGIAEHVGPRYFRRYGMPLSAIVKTRQALAQGPAPFVISALRDGVTVAGTPLAEVVSDAQG
jgi:DNA-binding transcriptional ArsR family regulator